MSVTVLGNIVYRNYGLQLQDYIKISGVDTFAFF